MKIALQIFHLVVSILLILFIIAQERGTGLSITFGGVGHVYHSRRGAEKIISIATVVLAVLFVGASLAFLFVR